jgi:signal transduction histidine kinase/DNA-binding response OmpR family regulator
MLVVAIALVVVNEWMTFKQDMSEKIETLALVISDYAEPSLAFSDSEDAMGVLAKLKAVEIVEYALLVDSRQRPFASFGEANGSEPAVINLEPSSYFTSDSLHVTRTIMIENEVLGALYIRASTTELNRKLLNHLLIMSGLLVVLVVVALLITYRLQRIISEPILTLAATMRAISESGDHTIRVKRHGDGEIMILCDGFNDMLDQIHLRQLERDAAELRTREKSQFLAAMSHELRTPLNSIIGFSEVLLRKAENLEERQRKFLSHILDSGKHLLGIINNILDLSKIEAGRMQLALTLISLAELIEGVTTIMRGAAQKNEIELQVEIEGEVPLIEADPVKLKQVLFNLISNAIKFSPEGSSVEITARSVPAAASPLGQDSVEVVVADHGIGIHPEDLEKIFEPFRQAESGVARRFGGTGLGLALVKAFVEKHQGQLRLDSTVGDGSTFYVTLPRSFSSDVVLQPALSRPTAVVTGAPDWVLIVDDNWKSLESARDELSAAGYQVVSADSASKALGYISQARPAAMIIGIVLPHADAWSVLKEIKSHRRTTGIPVVLNVVLDSNERGLALGLDDCLIKPIDAKRLEVALDQHVPGKRKGERRVLAVSDDRDTVAQLEMRLEARGLTLEHTLSSKKGLALVEERPPELAIIDLLSDRMGGIGVALALLSRSALSRVPIVALTVPELSDRQRRRMSTIFKNLDTGPRSLVYCVRKLVARQAR